MITVKIGSKGELVVPKKIRESLGIVEGGSVQLRIQNNEVILSPPQESIVEKWRKNPNRKNLEHLDLNEIFEKQYEEKFKDLLTS